MSSSGLGDVGRRYRLLRLLGQGGMGRVYAAHDRLSNHRVALKQVALPAPLGADASGLADTVPFAQVQAAREDLPPDPLAALTAELPSRLASRLSSRLPGRPERGPELPATPPRPSDLLRLRLAQEFRTLASMRHPHIVSVLDYGFDEARQPFYTMELLVGASPLLQGAGQPLDAQVTLLAQLLRALCYLHRRGVLHRDLKPANLLVLTGPRGPTLKVLDFGLALARERANLARGEISGTLGFLAPEVLLGAPPSEAADLFAAGAVAYQLLTGRPAFTARDDGVLLADVLAGRVDPAPLRSSGRVGDVVARLLARAPEDRFPSAADALAALAEASGQPLLTEDRALRDSFLHAARFVGRERESAILRRALAEAAHGRGSTWLIGGASGIGKSRLIDELRAQALVQGVLTARGQAATSSSRPYRVFQDALRLLRLHVELTDLEAGVLRPLLPELDGRRRPPAAEVPVLDAQGTQQRVLRVITAMLSRLDQPLLLLLEDLQWADAQSLALLQHLTQSAATRPLLLVGTYRDDEAPRLPSLIPDSHALKLARLSPPSVAALSESILGPPGRRADLLSLLEKETEGNAFFLVEVLRALAEQAGGLSAVATGPLPAQVFSGGVRAVLERRLDAVPLWARLGLRQCAVLGRRLDLQALPRFVPTPERFLQACADAGVLEVADDTWHFSHDKLRERILESLAPEEAAALHRDVAEALEAAHPESAQHSAQYSAAIAEHHELAGAPARAAPHRVRAAALALQQGALEAAVRHSRAALAVPDGALSPLEQARAGRCLVHALYALRHLDECIAAFEGLREPAAEPQRLARAVQGALRHGRVLLRTPAPATERDLARERFLTGIPMGEVYVTRGQTRQVATLVLRSLALAEQAEDAALRVMSSVGLGIFAELLGLRRISDGLIRRGERYLQGLCDPRAQLEYLRISGLLLLGRGELAQAEQRLQAALRCADELDEEEQRLLVATLLASHAGLRGERLLIERRAHALELAAAPSQHPQYLAASRLYRAQAALYADDLGAADSALRSIAEPQRRLPLTHFFLWSHRALLELRRGDRRAAARCVAEALELVPRIAMHSPAHLLYLSSLLEVCLELARQSDGSERARFLTQTERALGLMRQLAARFPVVQARRWLYEGQAAELAGRRARARTLLLRAQDTAVRQELPFDRALTHRALARLDLGAAEPAHARLARQHLAIAATQFARLGAVAEQRRTLQLLDE
ncbi:MAG: AAA family ATPase [Polyangia bacterium]